MTWRAVPQFPNYVVNEQGSVMDARTGRPAPRASRSDSGYLRVKLDGRLVRVHRAVLFAFRGPPPSSRHHGAHENGNKDDNRLRNLTWKLPVENEADKKKHGTAPRGGHQHAPSPQVVGRVLAAVSSGESFSRVARRFGLHRSSVSRYARGLRRAA